MKNIQRIKIAIEDTFSKAGLDCKNDQTAAQMLSEINTQLDKAILAVVEELWMEKDLHHEVLDYEKYKLIGWNNCVQELQNKIAEIKEVLK